LLYRGYDSYGFAVLNEKEILTYKKSGSFENLEENVKKTLKGKVGIAHTRWATKGEVNEKNAHPHFGCKMKLEKGIYHSDIAIVHNGQVSNYERLREKLEIKGHHFWSNCDSEIFAHLLEETPSVDEYIKKIEREVRGTYALLALDLSKKELIAVRNGNPLVMGISSNGIFLSSDINALLDLTKKFIILKDGEYARIRIRDI
jgi:glucosamine--fructose-6-phosphate aminotransferase (isomerizing)